MKLSWAEPSFALETYLALESFASEPYTRFVYGDAGVSQEVQRALLLASAGEAAPPYGKLAIDERGEVVGMLAGPLVGAALTKARFGAAAVLRKLPQFNPTIQARMAQAGAALIRIGASDAYLSRVAVAEQARRSGVGAALLARFLDDARAAGATRAVLEVAVEHEAARSFYARHGFTEFADGVADDAACGRSLRYHHLELTLASR